jgi:hypothetical protein
MIAIYSKHVAGIEETGQLSMAIAVQETGANGARHNLEPVGCRVALGIDDFALAEFQDCPWTGIGSNVGVAA